MINRSVIIIPNERISDIPIYEDKTTNLYHDDLLRMFFYKYKLFDLKGHYDLVRNGFIVILTVEDLAILEVPPSMSLKQYEYLKEIYPYLQSFPSFIGGIVRENIEGVYNVPDEYENDLLSYFYTVINEKCVIESRQR